MNGFIIHFVSGDAFFSGIFLILASIAMSFHARAFTDIAIHTADSKDDSPAIPPWKTTYRSLVRLIFMVGLIFLALSSTPLPLFLELLLYILPASLMIILCFKPVRRKYIVTLASLSSTICVLSIIAEIPYQRLPPMPKASFDKAYVVGDSVSAGVAYKGEKTWPEIAAERCHVKITNLSQGGGTAGSALSQVKVIKDKKALIFLEIGGNDMLGRTPLPEYRRNMEKLLKALQDPERIIVMVEVPWAPFHGSFCRAQRELAEKYDVILVPRRIFAGVLAGKESTVDGIHLSNQGHEKMAKMFIDVCGSILCPQK